MNKPCRRPATTPSSAYPRALLPEARSVISSVDRPVTPLVARLVGFIVFVLSKVPLPEVVSFMRLIILAFAHPLLVPLVFRIILVLTWAFIAGDAIARTVPPMIPVATATAKTQTYGLKFIRIKTPLFVSSVDR